MKILKKTLEAMENMSNILYIPIYFSIGFLFRGDNIFNPLLKEYTYLSSFNEVHLGLIFGMNLLVFYLLFCLLCSLFCCVVEYIAEHIKQKIKKEV